MLACRLAVLSELVGDPEERLFTWVIYVGRLMHRTSSFLVALTMVRMIETCFQF